MTEAIMRINSTLILSLTAVSLLCLMILVGLYFYSGGTILPATNGAGPSETLEIWVSWSVIVAVPMITAALWIIRLWQRRS
jgi:hypothetical protein